MVKSLLKKVNDAVDPVAKQKAIKELKDDLGKNSSVVRDLDYGTGQEDVTELLLPLFDELYGIGDTKTAINRSPLIEASEISPISEKDKKKYKSKPTKLYAKCTIELDIAGGKNSISGLLKNFQTVENLSNGESPRYVKGNGIEEDAEEGSVTLKSSRKLSLLVKENAKEIVVSTKRFKYDIHGNRSKIQDAINLDDIELDIAGKKDKKAKFKPTAFIVHSGEFGGGHYLAYVQEVDEKGKVGWYEYDDSRVRKISEDEKCIPRQVLGKSICDTIGLDPEKSVSFLELRKKQAYVVKYSKVNEQGKVDLPQRNRVGAVNAGNTCWANSAAAFAGSFTSFGVARVVAVDVSKISNDVIEKEEDALPKKNNKKQVRFASKDDVSDQILPQKPAIPEKKSTIMAAKQDEQKVQSSHNNKVVPQAKSKKESLTLEEKVQNVFIKSLRKMDEEKSSKEIWDDMSLVEKKVFVHYYNKFHQGNEIKLSSLYKKVAAQEDADITTKTGKHFALKKGKEDEIEKIVNNAMKYRPKTVIHGCDVEKLNEEMARVH